MPSLSLLSLMTVFAMFQEVIIITEDLIDTSRAIALADDAILMVTDEIDLDASIKLVIARMQDQVNFLVSYAFSDFIILKISSWTVRFYRVSMSSSTPPPEGLF